MTTKSEVPTDVLLQSRQAKSYLMDRCTLLGIDPFSVAQRAGVSRERFTQWINAIAPEDLVSSVTPQEAMEILESLAIYPRVAFVVVPEAELSEEERKVINELKAIKA